MGWTFRKSFRLGKGTRLNLGKRGFGVSTGIRGLRISSGSRGTKVYGGWGPFRFQRTLSSRSNPGAEASSESGFVGCLILLLVLFPIVMLVSSLIGPRRAAPVSPSASYSFATQPLVSAPASDERTASGPLQADSKPAPVERVEAEEPVSSSTVPAPTAPAEVEPPGTEVPAPSQPSPRVWTDKTGRFNVRATLVRVRDSKATLAKEDGRTLDVSVDQLADADQRYLEQFTEKALEGKVIAVADGDTLSIIENLRLHRIRLEGIDAPESGQAWGTQAKKALSEKVFGQQVTVKWKTKDKYSRVLGHVYLGDRWVNKELIEEGMAWHYKQYSSDADLDLAEKVARAEPRGLWRDFAPVPPWEYRHPSPSTPRASQIEDKPTASFPRGEPSSQTVYITATGQKYHSAGCRYLSKSRIPISLDEAAMRYSPCSVCAAKYLRPKPPQPAEEVSDRPGLPTSSSGGTVHVRGYSRKDGTYVRPHTRSSPRR